MASNQIEKIQITVRIVKKNVDVAQMDFLTGWTHLLLSGGSEILNIFSPFGLLDMRLANKTYYTQSWGVYSIISYSRHICQKPGN